jgi:hypothetical protein
MPDTPPESQPLSTPGIRAPTLWRHADFMKLWVGQTISFFGSALTRLALPLIAALILKATPAQMGRLAFLWVLFSPIRHLTRMPETAQ